MNDAFPKPRPKAGSLPLEQKQKVGPPHPAQFANPPFIPADELEPEPEPKASPSRKALAKLKAATRKVDKLRVDVRDSVFDEWVSRCLVDAERPNEWTRATELYENYRKRAPSYGGSMTDRRLLKLELASETRFGILMRDAGFTKKRRSNGQFYPLRLKQGA